MKNKLFKSLIVSCIGIITLCSVAMAKDIATCYSSFGDWWNKTGSTKTGYFWEEGDNGWTVFKAEWNNATNKDKEKYDEYSGDDDKSTWYIYEENYKVKVYTDESVNGISKINGKYFIMENGIIADNTNTSGYANKKDAEKVQKNGGEEEKEETEEKEEDEDSEEDKLSKIKLPILEDGIDGSWHEATDVSSITNASSNDWVFITSDNDLIKNGFIVVKELNSDKYNVSKFNKDGIWEGYLDKTGTLSKTSGNNKTLDEVIEIAKNKSKASTLNLDSQEEGELEDNSSGYGGSSGSGGSSGGSSNGSSSGKKKSYKVEKVDSIEPTFKLSDLDYLRNSNGLQMFGMCISKDYARVNEMTEWYNKDDNMVKAGDWFEKAKYTWNITKDLLNNAMTGKNYNYGDKNTFRYDTKVLQSMQGKITEVQQEKKNTLFSTILLIVGVFIVLYGIVLAIAWFLDARAITFMVDGSSGGLFNILTIGRYLAVDNGTRINEERLGDMSYREVGFFGMIKMVALLIIIGLALAVPPTREFVVFVVKAVIDWVAKAVGFTMEDL